VRRSLEDQPELKCGLMPIPTLMTGDTPTFAGGEMTTWGVWKDSHQDAAKRLVAYYAKPENVTAVANSNKLPAEWGSSMQLPHQYYTQYDDLRMHTYFDRIYLPNGMWDVLYTNGQAVSLAALTEQATETMAKSTHGAQSVSSPRFFSVGQRDDIESGADKLCRSRC
jgi:raffinose/stachyose/melibiose transport system substrate-binding protein